MKKITVGIPRALLFYYHQDLWIHFFEQLHVKVILSEKTTTETLRDGESFSIDEACLSLKIFLGHVKNLVGRCDFIFIPRLYCIKKEEQVCTNFNALYDLVFNLFDTPWIHYNIDLEKKKTELLAFIHLGEQLGFSYIDSYKAYQKAKRLSQERRKEKIEDQKEKLSSSKLKILLAGHPYNIYDPYISKEIIDYLRKENIEILYSDLIEKEKIDISCAEISTDIHWTHSKEMMASIHEYQDFVDGIILISSFPCGPDSLSMEMIKRKVNIPLLHLIFEQKNNDTGILTRLESFLDILKSKKEKNHERNH